MVRLAKIVVIDGTDGSGKQTQTEMLVNRLNKEGKKIYKTSFPNYESLSSGPVKMYLNGDITENPNEISAKIASQFFAIDRYITYKKEMKNYIENPDYKIVLDRYSSSNIIHQGSKILIENDGKSKEIIEAKLKEFITWLDNEEHEFYGIPRANITFYLHVPYEYSLKLMNERKNKITGESKKDIHEANNQHLINAEKAGMMAAKILNWQIIECIKDGEMRTIDDIHQEIYFKYNK